MRRTVPMHPGNDDFPRGKCRWCAGTIRHRNGAVQYRRRWHPECVELYKIATSNDYAYAYLVRRDGLVCQGCGEPLYARAEVDHKVPLWSVDKLDPENVEEIERLRHYWSVDNLQLLCRSCHKRKSAAEAAQRASLRSQTREES